MNTIVNSIGREIPDYIEGYGKVKPYIGQNKIKPEGRRYGPKLRRHPPGESKVLKDIKQAIERTGLSDGMTISFHHHFREGDLVVNQVIDTISKMGIKDITVAASALFEVHKPLIDHIKNGTVTALEGSCNGSLGYAISKGLPLKKPVILRSHGGRVRAIEAGELKIDVAFIAAPEIDFYGNMNGVNGPSACGPLAYAKADAMYADQVVAITDNLVDYPACPISIPQYYVDYIVPMDKIGNPELIVSGTTRVTRSPTQLLIAKRTANFISKHPDFKNGFCFQAGAGGISLAMTIFLRKIMKKQGICASFVNGGSTQYVVEMLEEATTKIILEGQVFDKAAIESLKNNPKHQEIDINFYANYNNSGNVVDLLDFGILGSTEIDLDFNVNVNTHSDGLLLHGIGGHQDVAAGASTTIITQPLMRNRLCCVVDNVVTATTPGDTVDVVVTEYGVSINPRREDLIEHYRKTNIPLLSIEQQQKIAIKLAGKPRKPELTDNIIAVVEYRDGTVIDVVRQVK